MRPPFSFKKIALQTLTFLCFFPYPSIFNLGENTGVQLNQAITLLIFVFALPMVLRSRSTLAFVLLLLPVLISLTALSLFGANIDSALGVRAALTVSFALLILPVAGMLLRDTPPEWLIKPVALAICIHAAAGAWQLWSFANGSFPFLEVLNNPSFADLQGISSEYATYVKRPFGLFPEPSAMAAAIGPWVLFLFWYGLRPEATRRVLALAATAAGTGLILFSQTLYSVFLLLGGFLILLAYRRSSTRRFSLLEFVIWALAGLSVLLLPMISAGRINVVGNNSSQLRFRSIVEGLAQPFGNLGSLLFGTGPGQSAQILADQDTGLGAIYSIVVLVFAEGGLIALVAMIVVIGMCVRRRERRFPMALLIGWVAGVAFSTSYVALSPIWLFLALMIEVRHKNEDSTRYPELRTGRSRTSPRFSGTGST
ncbi:hypothetical protein [Cryobacterium shii]|uniref:O-antigen ligase domain-containing protein n=1 Tax=Cryobacterium shii TaxID=1259235 RepID=A0AAQ2HFQ8_9MICO|nr:hypothetical protein [Cryobacterium shii]TFC47322.1 hypothetical protein E3O49_08300 [Cryobacterium shii]